MLWEKNSYQGQRYFSFVIFLLRTIEPGQSFTDSPDDMKVQNEKENDT